MPNLVEYILDAFDVEIGLLLPGKRSIGQILGGGRRAHGHRHVAAAAAITDVAKVDVVTAVTIGVIVVAIAAIAAVPAIADRTTITMLVPVQYQRLMDFAGFDAFDLSSLKLKYCTSAPFSAELKRAFADVLKAKQEGQAALERARGESAALRNLANAARLLDGNPALQNLRLLQSLTGAQQSAYPICNFPPAARGHRHIAMTAFAQPLQQARTHEHV